MNGIWVAHDIRDKVVDFVNSWSVKADITVHRFVTWLGISAAKFNGWKKRYGKVNEHNRLIPRDNWIDEWEKKAILEFYVLHPDEGYRRLTFMLKGYEQKIFADRDRKLIEARERRAVKRQK